MRRALWLVLALSAPAHGSVFDVYGFTPRARAMGNAHVAATEDFTAAFYNPGALTWRKQVNVGAGLVTTIPRLRIERDYAAPFQREVHSELPEQFSGLSLGGLFPLGGIFEKRVAIGAGLYLPLLRLLRADAVDAQVPQFYRYEALPDKFVVLASVAWQPTDWLGVGGGVQVLATLDGAVDFGIELANRRVLRRQVVVEIFPTAAPVFGVHLTPTKALRIGASFRGSVQLDYALPGRIDIDELLVLGLDLRGTVLYTPDYYNFGVAWQAGDTLLSTELSWARWSQAPDPSPHVSIDLSGSLIEGLGADDRLDVTSGAPVDLRFRDVVAVKLGVEHHLHPQVAARAGYTWRPSPAPVPDGPFNYVDNDAHVVAVGFGITFADPLEVRQNPVTIDVVYQATLMQALDVHQRAGADDRVGDYTADGVVHSLGVAFRHDL